MSSSRRMRYSSSSIFTSEPEYLPNRILSPALTGEIRPRVINVDRHPAYPTCALPQQHHRAGSALN
jgi:hypothetical protein